MVAWFSDGQCQEDTKQNSKISLLRNNRAMHTILTRAVKTLNLLPPLEFVVERKARSKAHRLWSLGCWSYLYSNRGHSGILMRLQQSDPFFYGVPMLTREEWTKGTDDHPVVKGLVWFTDGFRMMEETGAGVYGQSVGRRLRFTWAGMQQFSRTRCMLSCPVFMKFNIRIDRRNSICGLESSSGRHNNVPSAPTVPKGVKLHLYPVCNGDILGP